MDDGITSWEQCRFKFTTPITLMAISKLECEPRDFERNFNFLISNSVDGHLPRIHTEQQSWLWAWCCLSEGWLCVTQIALGCWFALTKSEAEMSERGRKRERERCREKAEYKEVGGHAGYLHSTPELTENAPFNWKSDTEKRKHQQIDFPTSQVLTPWILFFFCFQWTVPTHICCVIRLRRAHQLKRVEVTDNEG